MLPLDATAAKRVRRRLAAIVVVGWDHGLPRDEEDAFAEIAVILAEIIEPQVAEFEGRIFKRTADAALIEFDSIVEAALCAATMRTKMREQARAASREDRVRLRMGVHLGDIIVDGDDFYGDGVNIAARLEGIAEPGGILISELVHGQIDGKVELEFRDLGEQALKNISKPVRVFEILDEHGAEDDSVASSEAPAFDAQRAIAVLPFANFSGDAEQEYFADGVTEDIITMLAGWRAFPVIARNSTFVYKGKSIDIKKVGRELGAAYVLEGSVRKSGNRVRITMQLIEAQTGHHVMAEKYDRDLTDLFELQNEIAGSIAGAIEPEVLKFERNRIVGQPQKSRDAYELYHRGMWHHYRYSKEDNLAAQELFRQALAIDADYPQAVAALALAICNAGYLGWVADPEANYRQSLELAQRAVALDRRDPHARFVLGLAATWSQQPDRAIGELREAIKLNPSYAAAYVVLGQLLTYAGHLDEAVRSAQSGIRLSPNDPRLFMWLPALAGALYQLRRYEEAVAAGLRSFALNNNWPHGLRYAIAGLAQLGRVDEAREAVPELKRLDRDRAFLESRLRKLFRDEAQLQHLLTGLERAGFS